jgi:DNA-binding transcriptional LysR family regulator
LVARKLGELPQINVASTSYIAQFGTPQAISDLSQHQLVSYSQGLSAQADGFCYQEGGVTHEVPMQGRLTVNNTEAYRLACVAGLGIIQAPKQGLQALLNQGSLVEVLPQYRPPALPIHLLYPHRRGVSRRLRAFIEFLTNTLAAANHS